MFLIKYSVLELNFAKFTLFRCFSYYFTFFKLYILDILGTSVYMLIKSLATRT